MSVTTKLWTKGIPAFKKSTASVFNKLSQKYDQVNVEEHKFMHYASSANFSKRKIELSLTGFNSFSNRNPHFPLSASILFSNLQQNDNFNPQKLAQIQQKQFHTTSSINDDKSQIENTDKNTKPSQQSSPGIISSMLKEKEETENQKESKQENEKFEEKSENESNENKESPFLRTQRISFMILAGTAVVCGPLLVLQYGAPPRDENGQILVDEYSNSSAPIAYIKRAWREVKSAKEEVVEPYSEKLLPDTLKEPYFQPPYTLVIELFDVLLRPTYDQVTGWRFKKRPGIEYFLQQVGPPHFEIVIFTKETGMTAYPLIDSMDSKGFVMYRLFRDAARYKSGIKWGNPLKGEWPKLDPYYQKDLRYLNRDLNRVVQVDCDRRAIETQPSNGLCLKPWDGSSTDTELYDLAAFLKTVATSGVDDVRPVLEHYGKYEDPLAAFKLAHTRMQEEQDKMRQELSEKKNTGSFGFTTIGKFFRS